MQINITVLLHLAGDSPSLVLMSSEQDWSAEIGILIAQLAGHYVFPDVAEQVGQVLRQRLADGAYRNLADEAALASVATRDMQSVNGDKHLGVQYSAQEIPRQQDLVVDTGVLRAERAMLTGHGFARIERLPGNVAVLDIRKFYEPSVAGAGAAAVDAMHLMATADVLLIDLRRNGGGEPDMVMLVSGFLFDERTHLVDLYFPAAGTTLQYWSAPFVPGPVFGGSKPVYVLISNSTVSGGEGMSYQLQQSKRATLVGETTRGAANFHYPYRVSAHLMSTIPSGYPVDPVSGGHWEGTGVQPDIPVPADRALDTAYRLALEHVLGLGEQGARRRIAADARQALAELKV
jgi:C-terminal processing protease CtpA/Prc